MREHRGTILSLASIAFGFFVMLVALTELISYSPYENPGALGRGVKLAAVAAVLIAGPIVISVGRSLIRDARAYAAWKRTLTPGEQFALSLAEAGAMEAAHLAWRDHNREVSAQLTESVMGEQRDSAS